MKTIIAALLLTVAAQAHAFDGVYFQGIWENQNYKTPPVAAGTLLTMKGAFDGLATPIAFVWHKGDPQNSLIPQSLQNAGVKPFSWVLLGCGGGFGNGTGTLQCGPSVNVAPTLLGPLAQPLKASGSPLAQDIGIFIADNPNGDGLAIGYIWNATPVANGSVLPFDHWGSHLDAFLGVGYSFK